MSPDRDPGRFDDDERDALDYDDDAPRSIFSTLWFRALLTVLVLGVLAAVAVPYVLDFATSPTPRSSPKSATAAAPTPAAPAPAAPAPAAPAPSAPVVTPAVPDSQASATAPPVETARPRSEPAPAAKPAAKPAPAKPAVVAKAVETPKPAETPRKAAEAPKAAETAKRPVKAAEMTAVASAPKAPAGPSGGSYWVQVGAFKDAETAKRVAGRLREQGFQTEESTLKNASAPRSAPAAAPGLASPPADRYDVLVSGATAADVDAKLAPKGLRGEITGGGVVVRPSLVLREAVSLSRDLADAGLSVQVRRVTGGAPAPAAPAVAPGPPPAPAGGETLHRVRVGGFSDRAAATAAMKRLEDKGFKPFIARGNE